MQTSMRIIGKRLHSARQRPRAFSWLPNLPPSGTLARSSAALPTRSSLGRSGSADDQCALLPPRRLLGHAWPALSQIESAPDLRWAFSALVEDLDQRGMLSQTGAGAAGWRTPRVNNAAGRDRGHGSTRSPWPAARAGTVCSVDSIAAHPTANPHDHAILPRRCITLSVPADTLVHDPTNRPHSLVVGRKMNGLLM